MTKTKKVDIDQNAFALLKAEKIRLRKETKIMMSYSDVIRYHMMT